jgi:translation initiation factor IF-3
VLGSDGAQLGVMPTEKAINLAIDEELDLVEVSPTSRPPVCRIMDYGKFKYEKSKRAKLTKKKQHVVHVKEIKLRPKTEEHDFQFKKKHAEEFLERHNKVKFTVFFRGREFDHQELGHRILARMREELSELGVVEKAPQFEGRVMTMVMAPHPTKGVQRPKPPAARDAQPQKPAAAERPSQQGELPDMQGSEREE